MRHLEAGANGAIADTPRSGGVFDRQHLTIVADAATAASGWTDWKLAHHENGPFVNEMLGDPFRWRREGVLSVMVQAPLWAGLEMIGVRRSVNLPISFRYVFDYIKHFMPLSMRALIPGSVRES